MSENLKIKNDNNIEDQFNWFSLRVISGKERTVEDNIMYESKTGNIDESIEEVFVPYEKVVQVRNNKKVMISTTTLILF